MNMVEKVAKAIYEKRNGKGCTPWAKRGMAHKVAYFSDARAAIEAMKEPTQAMLAAGKVASCVDDIYLTADEVGGIWPAMITGALSEESAA